MGREKTNMGSDVSPGKGGLLFHSFMLLLSTLLISGCVHNGMSPEIWDKSISAKVHPQLTDYSWINSGPKVIIITGSASGFGKAAAQKLIDKGHIVYGGDINIEGNKYLDAMGGISLQMDVRKDSQVQSGIQRILKEQGRIDVLINNAGYGEYATIENININDLKNQFDVNVFGCARLQQAVLPIMRKQRFGRVIIVSSAIGKFSMPVLGWYASTKHAVEGMADALRQEVSQFNIDVIKIQPGAANTNFGKTAYERMFASYVPDDYKKMVADFKVGLDAVFEKAGGPEETADAIVEAVEVEDPKMTYVTMENGKSMIEKRNNMTEEEFYAMFSK